MKIGILTLPLHTNYGGILQAFALMTVLKTMEHDVWIINRKYKPVSLFRYYDILGKQMIIKYILRKDVSFILNNKETERRENIIQQYTRKFIEKYLQPQTEAYYSSKQLIKRIAKNNFDIYVVGSDQVWRPKYAKDILYDFFFSFLNQNDKVKKFTYAASFGTEEWEFTPEQTEKCSILAKRFDAISIREDSGIKLCKEKFDIEAFQVLDPTMLLDKSEYIKLIDKKIDDESDNELLVYILDNSSDKDMVVERIGQKYHYKPFKVNTKTEDSNKGDAPLEELIAPPIENWIIGFYTAKFIVTDSFHACIFSILFNKPFIVYGNRKRGLTRYTSLLKMFGLENRLIFSVESIEQVLSSEINWDNVNFILDEKKFASIKFLTKALNE